MLGDRLTIYGNTRKEKMEALTRAGPVGSREEIFSRTLKRRNPPNLAKRKEE